MFLFSPPLKNLLHGPWTEERACRKRFEDLERINHINIPSIGWLIVFLFPAKEKCLKDDLKQALQCLQLPQSSRQCTNGCWRVSRFSNIWQRSVHRIDDSAHCTGTNRISNRIDIPQLPLSVLQRMCFGLRGRKISYLCSRKVYRVFCTHLFPAFDHFGVLLLYCGSEFHNQFDNIMTQFIINKRTDA